MILEDIVESTKERVETNKKRHSIYELKEKAFAMPIDQSFPFKKALEKDGMSYILEVKRHSPSKGQIVSTFDFKAIAKEYEMIGADAISVVTEPDYFKGDDDFLREIKRIVKIPVLRKDFVVDEYMVYEAKILGADAILFNGHTNINLNNPLINFDISGLQDNTGSRILLTQYFNILSFIWTQVISDSRDIRKQIYADEYGIIMDPDLKEVMKYFSSISRRIRKRIGGLTVATQQISDVLKDEVKSEGEVIINQSGYQFFFNLAGETEYFKGTKILPESAQEFIQFANIGECYAKFGSQTAMTTQIIIPPDELRFFESIKK